MLKVILYGFTVGAFGSSKLQRACQPFPGRMAFKYLEVLQALSVRGIETVTIVFDLDQAGKLGTVRAGKLVRDAGMTLRIGQLPAELGDEADVGDLFKWHNLDALAFARGLEELPNIAPPDPHPLADTRFSEEGDRYHQLRSTRDRQTRQELTIFTARVVQEMVRDYGMDRSRYMMVESRLETGETLQRFQVPPLIWMASSGSASTGEPPRE